MTTNIFDLEKSQKLDDENIHELISGIQKVSQTGVTQLPSRDICLSTQKNVQDIEAIPNYVPSEKNGDGIIGNHDNDDFVEPTGGEPFETQENNALMSSAYEELQLPLFVSILYFMFQLPGLKKYVYNFLPSLFLADGTFNIYGHIFMSVSFSTMVYFMTKYLSTSIRK